MLNSRGCVPERVARSFLLAAGASPVDDDLIGCVAPVGSLGGLAVAELSVSRPGAREVRCSLLLALTLPSSLSLEKVELCRDALR